jgi:hypothetical protein
MPLYDSCAIAHLLGKRVNVSVMFAIKRLILSAKRSQQAAALATQSIVQAAKK